MTTMTRSFFAALALSALAFGAPAQEAGDAEAGEKVYRKCKACHVLDEETNRVGPHLVGIVGRDVASVEGYSYSDAMTAWGEGKVWDAETLSSYLEDPKGVVEGTKMTFPGLDDAQDRADLIAYMEGAGAD